MFLAMNRFKIVKGKEDKFIKFNLMKGSSEEDFSLYASHSIWESKEAFIDWTKSF